MWTPHKTSLWCRSVHVHVHVKLLRRFHFTSLSFKLQTLLIFFILSSLLSCSIVLSSWPLPHLATVHHCLVAASQTPIRKIDIKPPAKITRNMAWECCDTWVIKSFTMRSLILLYQTTGGGCIFIKHAWALAKRHLTHNPTSDNWLNLGSLKLGCYREWRTWETIFAALGNAFCKS